MKHAVIMQVRQQEIWIPETLNLIVRQELRLLRLTIMYLVLQEVTPHQQVPHLHPI